MPAGSEKLALTKAAAFVIVLARTGDGGGRLKQVVTRLWPWLTVAAAAVALSLLVGCPVRRLLGLGCPFCGMSRALLRAAKLDLPAAFRFHPLWPLCLPAPVLGTWLFRRRPGAEKWLLWGLLAVFLTVWVLRLVSRDPMVRPL